VWLTWLPRPQVCGLCSCASHAPAQPPPGGRRRRAWGTGVCSHPQPAGLICWLRAAVADARVSPRSPPRRRRRLPRRLRRLGWRTASQPPSSPAWCRWSLGCDW